MVIEEFPKYLKSIFNKNLTVFDRNFSTIIFYLNLSCKCSKQSTVNDPGGFN